MGKENPSLLSRLLVGYDAKLQIKRKTLEDKARSVQEEIKEKELKQEEIRQNFEKIILPLEATSLMEASNSEVGKLFDDFLLQLEVRFNQYFSKHSNVDWGTTTFDVKDKDRVLQMYHENNNIRPIIKVNCQNYGERIVKRTWERKLDSIRTEVTEKGIWENLEFGWVKTGDTYDYYIGKNISGNLKDTKEEVGGLAEIMASILKNEKFDSKVFYRGEHDFTSTSLRYDTGPANPNSEIDPNNGEGSP